MAVYPEVRAGMRITNDILTAAEELFIVKATSTARTSTTTFADDPELTTQLLANARYYVEMHLQAACGPGDIKTNWTVPTSTCLRSCWGPGPGVVLGSSRGEGNIRMGVHGATTTVTYGTRNDDNGLQYIIKERGYVLTTAAGTLALSWAQNSSNATSSRVTSNSYMVVRRLG